MIADAWNAKTFDSILAYEPSFCNSSFAISRSLLLGALPELRALRGGEDSFLFLLGAARGRWLYLTSDRLTRYRIHRTGATAAAPDQKPSSAQDSYLRFVQERHLNQNQILSGLLPANAPPHLEVWIERDHAVWVTLYRAAGGDPRSKLHGTIRSLVSSDPLKPQPRDLACAALAWCSLCARGAVSRLFLASRRIG